MTKMSFQSSDGIEVKSTNDMVLSIIIPVYNNVNFTKAAIQDLLMLPKNHEIIVVDNNSYDETEQVLSELRSHQNPEGAKLITIRCPRNLGFGRANNKGYKHSSGRNILFLNNDVRVKKDKTDWTKEMVQLCDEGWL